MGKKGIVYAKEVPMIKVKKSGRKEWKRNPSAGGDSVLDKRWNHCCRGESKSI